MGITGQVKKFMMAAAIIATVAIMTMWVNIINAKAATIMPAIMGTSVAEMIMAAMCAAVVNVPMQINSGSMAGMTDGYQAGRSKKSQKKGSRYDA